MERDAEQTPPLVAAPRHLRRRRFRADISDPLLVPDAEPFPVLQVVQPELKVSPHPKPLLQDKGLAYRRKRAVAFWAVVIVSISVPALALALVFAG